MSANRRRLLWHRGRLLLAPFLILALIAALPEANGAFTATTTNASALTSAASFPTYPASVAADSPALYHRSDDGSPGTFPSSATDSSGNSRTGTYGASTNAPSTWYRFDDGSGTTAADASGSGNPGTLTNGPTWTGGHVGARGLTFDATNDFVSGAASAVDTSTSYTVTVWAYMTDLVNHHTLVSQDGTNVSGFFLQYNGNNGEWGIKIRDTDSTSATFSEVWDPAGPVLNRWTHLAAVYDDANDLLKLYVDGALAGTAAKTVDWAATGSLIVGAGRYGAGTRSDHYEGSLDDIRTYRRALTDAEITQVYGMSTWWTFDAATTSQSDFSGQVNTGTLAGSPTFGSSGVTLDGASQYATGASVGAHTDRSFAVAAWAYPTTTTGTRVIASQSGAQSSAFRLGAVGTAWQFTVTGSDIAAPSATTATATTAVAASTRYHLVGVYSDEADELRIYVNGQLENTATVSSDWDATGVLNAGRYRSAGSYTGYFQGRVDDLKVYPHALAGADVYDLYTSPLARYDMEETTGTTLTDSSGNGNTTTRTGTGNTWNPHSHHGGSLSLSSSTYFSTARPVLDTSTSYSVSAWVWLPSAYTGTAGARTVLSQDGTNTGGFMLQHTNIDGTNQWEFQVWGSDDTSNSQIVLSSSTASGSRWTHLAAVYDDSADSVKIYVNGVLAGTGTATADFNATGPLVLGAAQWGGSRGSYWPGYLDEVATYQSVLSAGDIARLHAQSPSVLWDVNENTGTTLGDRSGSSNSGTVANGTWNTSGARYNSMSFGSTTQVTTTAAPLATDTSFSVSLWVYLTSTTSVRYAASQNGTNIFGYGLGYDNTLNKWVFRMKTADATGSGTLDTASSTSTPGTANWTHLVAVYNDPADEMRLYVDGVLEATTAHATDWNATGQMVLGYGLWSGVDSYHWNGRVDEVAAYKRVLDYEEIRALSSFTFPIPKATAAATMGTGFGVPGALQGAQQGQTGSTAVSFDGTAAAYNGFSYVNPSTFTIEGWFRASGSAGGALIGFTTSTTSMSTTADRVIYLDSGGKLTFGVAPGGTNTTVRSTMTYNDGAWHHMAASLGAAGMKLYVDGALVASATGTTTALNATGYWRWGGNDLTGWANSPSSEYLIGTLDEVAIYTTQLTDNKIARHFAANH
jgi:hypothetical protein